MFNDVQVYTGVPQAQMPATVPATTANTPTSAVAVEQSRAIAEAQAAMIVARSCPRDENTAYARILAACKRPSFAESAQFAYKRGGSIVSGVTIRFAEAVARHWGNLSYGFREIGRKADASEIEAFCWDMESNVRATRTFVVRHARDLKSGVKELTSERDKYEMIANMAQRRVRAVILQSIPGDIIESAVKQCDKTLAGTNDKPIEDRVREMVAAFAELGVTVAMLEDRLQHKLSATVPAEIVTLKKVYRSIRDGVAGREEFFNLNPANPNPANNPTHQKPVPPKAGPAPTPPQQVAEPPQEDGHGAWARSQWINLRSGFMNYVQSHIATLGDQPEAVQAQVREKWSRQIGTRPFPQTTEQAVPGEAEPTAPQAHEAEKDWMDAYPPELRETQEFSRLVDMVTEHPEIYSEFIDGGAVPESTMEINMLISAMIHQVEKAKLA